MADHTQAPAGRQTVAIGTTRTRLVSSDPERRSFIVSPPVAGRLWLFPDENLSARDGLSINWNDLPLELCCCLVGRLIAAPWSAIIEAGDGPITDRWDETESATNAITTAIHAAVADRRHQFTGITVSFGATTSFATVDLEVNAVVVFRQQFTNNYGNFSSGPIIEGGPNEAIETVLSAGAVGVTGHANMWGVTIDAGDAGANVGIIESTLDKHHRE